MTSSVQDPLDAELVKALSAIMTIQREYTETLETAMALLMTEVNRLTRPPLPALCAGVKRATVCNWGLELVCHYEFSEAEAESRWVNPCPGTPAYVSLGACYHNGGDLMEMLSKEQVADLEQMLLMEETEQ